MPKIKQTFLKRQLDLHYTELYTGIFRFTLLMWGHENNPQKQKSRKLRLFSRTKGEENRIEL